MFHLFKKSTKEPHQLFIHAERSSVCMGDDCTAPNSAELGYEPGQKLSEFIPTIVKYVPNMKNAWWEVRADKQLLVTVSFNAFGKSTYKLNGPDIKVADIPGGKIFCKYYY